MDIFEVTQQNRRNLLSLIISTPKEKLLEIPEGFNNNIFWNIAHIIVVQQVLLYKFSGLQMRIPLEMVTRYSKGTKPDGLETEEEIKVVADLIMETNKWVQEDYDAQLFKNYNAYTTSAKVTLNNIDNAMAFNLFHEGLHFGAINLIRKRIG